MLTWDDEVTNTPGPTSDYRVLKRANRKFPPAKGETTSTSTTGAVGATNENDGEGDDGDGGGDGDPDSDRRKLVRKPISAALATVQSATSIRILRMPAVKVRVGLSRSTIYEAISRNEFPASVSLGARAVGWLESEIDAWLESRVSASKATAVTKSNASTAQDTRIRSFKQSQE